jgi:hypothetical protein
MTRRIADEVDAMHGRYRRTSQALNLAIGAMIAHDTSRGNGAFDGIDVERLFAAVQMLADRDNLEVSPFVSWNASLESIEGPGALPAFWAKDFKRAILSDFDSRLERSIADAVRGIMGTSRGTSVFHALERDMIAALQRAVYVDPGRVDYLSPLLNVGSAGEPVQIATLNYDRSVELLAARAGRELDTGVGLWAGGYEWDWEAGAEIRLLKMHGSADWYLGGERAQPGRLHESKVIVTPDWSAENLVGGSLGVVFGQRGKLRSEGPFLAMLRGLDDFLARTDHLVVVGYSLRDEHINTAIRRWFNRCDSPRVTLVDPSLPELSDDRRGSPFLKELLRAMTGDEYPPELNPAHEIVRLPASEALFKLFGAGPSLEPVDSGAPPPAPLAG